MSAGFTEILQYLPYLLAAYLAFGVGLLSPGPNILAIVGMSMGHSRRAGLVLACGISTGSMIWSMLAVFGLTAVLASFAWFGIVLKVVGGCYLLWLSSRFFKAARAGDPIKVNRQGLTNSITGLYLQGLAIQMTNPKAAIHWISIMSLVLRPDVPVWVMAAMIIGNGVVSFGGHIAWAVLFSTARVVAYYGSAKRVVDSVIGTIFGVLGLGLLFAAVKRS